MREIKFRAWDKDSRNWFPHEKGDWLNIGSDGEIIHGFEGEVSEPSDRFTICQFTGLKDKNGLTEIYEGDIIGVDGLRKGNQYENADLLKDQVNLLIQGFGTASWETTNKKAMERGCKYSQ